MSLHIGHSRLGNQEGKPKCSKCGRTDNVIAVRRHRHEQYELGEIIPDHPNDTWRCATCDHEWPREARK